MTETGVVKFSCEHIAAEIETFAGFDELGACRDQLFARNLIGVDANGIAFGNLSVRDVEGRGFFVTASGSSGKAQLAPSDYALVTHFDLSRNWLRCEGAAVASSESLTHAAVYQADASAGAVIHVHTSELWNALANRAPSTSAEIEYGTPAMAEEILRLLTTSNVTAQKIIRMGGHEGGMIAFGRNPAEAQAMLMRFL